MVDVAGREGVSSLLTKGTTLLADVDAGEGAQSVSHTDRTCLQVGVGRLHPPVASSIITNVVSVSGSDVICETIFHDALETPTGGVGTFNGDGAWDRNVLGLPELLSC